MKRLLMFVSVFIASAGLALAHSGQRSGVPHPTLPECRAGDPLLILPDLIPDTPTTVRTRLAEGQRVVEFTTAIANVGPGALLVEGKTITTPSGPATIGYQLIDRRDGSRCAREAGVFEFHRAHSHFHFDDFVGYEVRSGDPNLGPLAVTGEKASYCLLDIEQMRGADHVRHPLLRNQLTCNEQEGIQGISVGFKDVYDRTLPGQLLHLDRPAPIPGGSYFLVNEVDPEDVLWESNKANNRAAASFSTGGPVNALTATAVIPGQGATPTRTPDVGPGRPTPRRTLRPDRPPRPPRTSGPPRGTPTSVRTSAGGATATPTPTRTPPSVPPVANCDNACPHYSFSQMRLTWYDAAAGGLNLTYYVQAGDCEPLTPEPGEVASIQMTRWLTQGLRDTGRSHIATFTLDSQGAGPTSTGGRASIGQFRGWQQVAYHATTPPIASPADGADFPVVFDLCLTVGNQAVKARMVCQEKNRGLLCHEG